MSYTETVNYIRPVPFSVEDGTVEGRAAFDTARQSVRTNGRVNANSPVYSRAVVPFSHEPYEYPAAPLFLGRHTLHPSDEYVLRLPVKRAGSADILLPKRLEWIMPILALSLAYQREHFPDILSRWCYVTVRSGVVQSNRDDELHVDGFQRGRPVARHIPEQSYLWADAHPTVFSMQPYYLADVDPLRNNVHRYFQDVTRPESLCQGMSGGLYVIDPYHVHMRPRLDAGTRRAMVRITFSPVEIEDHTNTPNPFLPTPDYNRGGTRFDVRNGLSPAAKLAHYAPGLTAFAGRFDPA